jgi:hypothetical protein
MPRSFLPSVLLGFATTALLAQVQPAQAQAIRVDVAGATYDVRAEEVAYADASARFNLITDGGEVPWWNSLDLARTFAEAVGDRLGSQPLTDEFGPLFAFMTGTDQDGAYVDTWTQYSQPPSGGFNFKAGTSDPYRYAFATKVTVPSGSADVPGPLPILGVSVCFGYARRLRRRQRASIQMD